jgi:hypothetical protein
MVLLKLGQLSAWKRSFPLARYCCRDAAPAARPKNWNELQDQYDEENIRQNIGTVLYRNRSCRPNRCLWRVYNVCLLPYQKGQSTLVSGGH